MDFPGDAVRRGTALFERQAPLDFRFSRGPGVGALGDVSLLALAEFAFDGAQKIPFTCSYLPGKSNLHLTFWLWIFLLAIGIVGAAVNELKALESLAASAAVLAGLGLAAAFCTLRNNWLAHPRNAELRFEEIPPGQLVSLDLS